MLRSLRLWVTDPAAVVPGDRTLVQEIAALLEWYICECLSYGPANLGGWWSDGVIHLEIDHPALDGFTLLGVTWIGCHGIAPFEIDVQLHPDDDIRFAKTLFRIGMLDELGQPCLSDCTRSPHHVLQNRPRRNQDWAMAIELMPPQSSPEPPTTRNSQ